MASSNQGGRREGAGRKPGSKSKNTKLVEAAIAKYNFDPIEGMMYVAGQAKKNDDLKLYYDVCKEILSYLAPKRKAIEVTGDGGGPINTVTKIELVAPDLKMPKETDED